MKQQLGLLTDADKLRLKELQDYFDNKLRLKELDELEELRKKLLAGTITEDELRRLRELEGKYGLEPIENPFDQQKQLNEVFEDNMQDDVSINSMYNLIFRRRALCIAELLIKITSANYHQ